MLLWFLYILFHCVCAGTHMHMFILGTDCPHAYLWKSKSKSGDIPNEPPTWCFETRVFHLLVGVFWLGYLARQLLASTCLCVLNYWIKAVPLTFLCVWGIRLKPSHRNSKHFSKRAISSAPILLLCWVSNRFWKQPIMGCNTVSTDLGTQRSGPTHS